MLEKVSFLEEFQIEARQMMSMGRKERLTVTVRDDFTPTVRGGSVKQTSVMYF